MPCAEGFEVHISVPGFEVHTSPAAGAPSGYSRRDAMPMLFEAIRQKQKAVFFCSRGTFVFGAHLHLSPAVMALLSPQTLCCARPMYDVPLQACAV